MWHCPLVRYALWASPVRSGPTSHAMLCPLTPTTNLFRSPFTRTFPSCLVGVEREKRSGISHGGEQTSCFETNGLICENGAMLHQLVLSCGNQSWHKHGGHIPSTPTLPPLAAARTGEIRGSAQATTGDHAKKTEGKLSRSSQTASHWELGVFPKQHRPQRASLGTCTVPGTALVPKCHGEGKGGPKEHGCQCLADCVLTRGRQSSVTP